MPQNSPAAPDWYPDGSGSQRYWDGSDWTEHTAPIAAGGSGAGEQERLISGVPATFATSTPAATPSPSSTGGRNSRTRRAAVPAAAGVLGLVLGLIFNSGDASHAELVETQAELTTTTTELDEQSALLLTAQEDLEASEDRVAELELAAADNAAAAQATADMETAQATRTTELDTREADLAARETAVGERETTVAEREEAVTVREASVPSSGSSSGSSNAAPAAPAPAAPAPAPAAPASTYYKNCTAAREAGAAPVYRGDPGYGGHLDRDGDGIGCE